MARNVAKDATRQSLWLSSVVVVKDLIDRDARVAVDLPVTPPVCDRGRCSLGRRCHFGTVAPLDADMAPGPASQ